MIEPTIKSRPGLRNARRRSPARTISSSPTREGAAAILDLAKAAPAGFFAGAHIIFIPRVTGDSDYVAALRGAEAGAILRGPFHRQLRCRG